MAIRAKNQLLRVPLRSTLSSLRIKQLPKEGLDLTFFDSILDKGKPVYELIFSPSFIKLLFKFDFRVSLFIMSNFKEEVLRYLSNIEELSLKINRQLHSCEQRLLAIEQALEQKLEVKIIQKLEQLVMPAAEASFDDPAPQQ